MCSRVAFPTSLPKTVHAESLSIRSMPSWTAVISVRSLLSAHSIALIKYHYHAARDGIPYYPRKSFRRHPYHAKSRHAPPSRRPHRPDELENHGSIQEAQSQSTCRHSVRFSWAFVSSRLSRTGCRCGNARRKRWQAVMKGHKDKAVGRRGRVFSTVSVL